MEVVSNQERSVNRFAVLAPRDDIVEESVVDALEFDFTREDSEPGQHTDSSEDFVDAERIDEHHGSEVSGEEEVFEAEELVEVEEFRAMPPGVRAALRLIDDWDLSQIFRRRANVMKSVPHCLKGPFRNAMKVLLDEIVEGWERNDGFRQERAWKAFLLLPRLFSAQTVQRGQDRQGQVEGTV